MKTIRKNKKEDIKLLIDLGENYHGEDLTLTFTAGSYGYDKYVCSYINGEAVNCVVDGSTVLCLLDNHRLPSGALTVEIDFRVPDAQMPDGDFRHVTRKAATFILGGEECRLELTNCESDYFPEDLVPQSALNLLPTVIKGDPGKDADIEGCNAAIAAAKHLAADVAAAEDLRSQAEQKRAEAEAARGQAETERTENETARQHNETLRPQAEAARVSKENDRQTAESVRTANENERIANENKRLSAETDRTQAENARAEAEAARCKAETNRTHAEQLRHNAEENRKAAEQQSINNENNRKDEETKRYNAENQRQQKETERQSAEQLRKQTETKREQDETARAEAETARNIEEAKRQNAENDRIAAETTRQSNETTRQNAEAIRQTKETERQTAETDRIANNEACVNATNKALTAANEATEAAKTATANATTAAQSANNAADRANEAADLVYNGNPVTTYIHITTDVVGVDVSGLPLVVWFDDNKNTAITVTTDGSGTASFDCRPLTKFCVTYPKLPECQDLPQTIGFVGIASRTYEIKYSALPAALEQLTLRVYKWTGTTSARFANCTVHVTIAGETIDYLTDSNGEVQLEIPYGTEYIVAIDEIEGLYTYGNIYQWTYIAGATRRLRVFNYRDVMVGMFYVCKDGTEYLYDEFVASGRDIADAVMIKVVTADLAKTNNVFGVDIDSIANGTYINNKMQWCVQNREFTTVPMGITADGLEHTVNIDNEGKTYAIATAAATYCLSKVFAIGDIELQGFLGAVQQKYALTANEKELNAMLAYVRPEAAYTFSKFFDTQTWTSDQFSSYFAYLCSRSANNLVRNNSGAVEPFYAF